MPPPRLLWSTGRGARYKACLALALGFGAACLIGIASALSQTAPVFTEVAPAQLDLTPDQQRILDKIRSEPAAAEVAVARLNPAELHPGPTPLRMFSTRDLTVVVSEAQPRESGARALSSGPGQPDGSATLVVRGAMVTGRVVSGGRIYSIRPLGDGLHAIVTIDETRFPPEHPESFERLELPPQESPPGPERRGDVPAGDSVPVIDVLVAFTPAVSAATPDPHGLAHLAIAQMNRSFLNSLAAAKVRLVHSTEVVYSEAAGYQAAVNHLMRPDDGQLDEVQGLRDERGADIVALLIDNGESCGLLGPCSTRSMRPRAFSPWSTTRARSTTSRSHTRLVTFLARATTPRPPARTPRHFDGVMATGSRGARGARSWPILVRGRRFARVSSTGPTLTSA